MLLPLLAAALAASADDRATVAALDVAYQAAVKASDAAAMDRILHPGFVLVVGSGTVISRADLIAAARRKDPVYEIQDEAPGSQTVRVFGPTAVVTAKLHIRYRVGATLSDRTLWFSDTYVKTPAGWRYAFGQASLPLPAA
jgi:hypothetical protein